MYKAILAWFALAVGSIAATPIAGANPPSIPPVYSLNVDGFPGDDGHDAVASCGNDIFYVRFGDRTIRQLRHNAKGAWVESAFVPQGSAAGYQFMRVYGSGNLLAALYVNQYSSHRIDLFERDSAGVWSLKQTITGALGAAFQNVNGLQWSGSTLMVIDRYADSFRGAAFIFDRDSTGFWRQTAKLQGSGAFPFYTEVWSATLDGGRAILGHWLNACGYGAVSGIAYIFEKNAGGAWNEVAALRPPTARCADAYAANVSLRGDLAVASAPGDNIIYRFDRSESGWTQGASLPIPVLAGNPAHGARLQSTEWGLLALTSDQRLVAYETFQGAVRVAAVLEPSVPYAPPCYCWNIATEGTRVVTLTSIPTGGARLSIFDATPALDCDGDGIGNAEEIAAGAADLDADGVPDECQSTLRVPEQFATIQAAIDATPAGTARTILVAAGTYNQSFSLNGKDIVVRGAPKGGTTIDGTGLATSVVRFTGGEPATAGIENLVIRNGTAGSIPFSGAPFRVGGGLFGIDSSAYIRNCRFQTNTADYGGGAYLVRCTTVIDDCDFLFNNARNEGGALQLYESSGPVVNSTFAANTANANGAAAASAIKAIGARTPGGVVLLSNCLIQSNTGGNGGAAIEMYANLGSGIWGTMRISNCEITYNGAQGIAGGVRVIGTFETCVIADGTTICLNAPRNISGPYLIEGNATVCDCLADLTLDNLVNGGDLGVVLASWGAVNPSGTGDANHDGTVNGADLALVLASWGACQ